MRFKLIQFIAFIIKIIEYCQSENIDLNKLPIRKILCIGENIRNEDFSLNALAQKIKNHS